MLSFDPAEIFFIVGKCDIIERLIFLSLSLERENIYNRHECI